MNEIEEKNQSKEDNKKIAINVKWWYFYFLKIKLCQIMKLEIEIEELNWKKNNFFTKGSRIKIKNQNNKNWSWNINNKEINL